MQLFNGLAIAAFLQGVAAALVIWFGGGRLRPAGIFGWILLILALLCAKILLHTTGLWQTRAFHYFPLAIDTTLPGLLILYATIVSGKPLDRTIAMLTLAPTAVFLMHAVIVYLGALAAPNIAEANRFATRLFYNEVKEAEDWFAIAYAIFCWTYCLRLIQRYRHWLFTTQSDSSLNEYTWLKNLLTVSGVLIIGLILLTSIENLVPYNQRGFNHIFIFYTYLASLTWYLSLKGLVLYRGTTDLKELPQQVGILQPNNDLPPVEKALPGEKPLPGEILQPTGNPITEDPRRQPGEGPGMETYDTLLVAKDRMDRIIHAMEQDHLYLDPELTLKALAEHIGDPVSLVSAAINQVTGKNFRTFVNEYRIEAVKKRLRNPLSLLSLLGVAIECGFNSEASFYRIFRQFEGMSPNEFLRKQK